jgi:hypothetical protein
MMPAILDLTPCVLVMLMFVVMLDELNMGLTCRLRGEFSRAHLLGRYRAPC